MTTYTCTDEASGGVSIDMTGPDAESVLAAYIELALQSPDSYNQGEEGISERIRAYVVSDDDDTDRAEGWIDFAAA